MISRIAILGYLLLQISFSPLDQGRQAFRAKNWPAAERFFTQAIQSAPNSALPYKWLGMTYAAQEKYLLAEEPFRSACRLDPKEPQACYYLARTLFLNSKFPEALQAFERLPSKDGPALLGLALTLDALARYQEADVFFRKAIAAGDKQAAIDYQQFLRRQAAPKPRPPELRFEPTDLPATVRNGAAGAMHLPETMLAGLAVFDFDNDGWPDIFLANGSAPCALLRNNHNGAFEDVTTKAGLAFPRNVMGVAVADFDNDGFLDLFLTGLHAQLLFRNRGDGAFEDITAKAGLAGPDLWTVSAAWLDYDNDGLLDLFVVRYVQWDPKTEPYCGTPAFRQYCDPRLYPPLPNALYRNLGNGRFRDVSEPSGIAAHKGKGMGVALGDYDNDGLPDLFVANDTEPNFLFRNLGGGRFEECALSAGVAFNENGKAISSMGAEFRDLDNDGFEDLFVTALTNETFPLFHNTGKSAFADHTIASSLSRESLAFSGWGAAAIDLDNDGWKDLAVANGHINARLSNGASGLEQSQIYINRGARFAAAALPGEALHRGLAYGDFDRDGRLDLVITRLNQPAQLWWNRNPSLNWIAFDVPAIGTLVKIETPQGAQWNRMVTTNGYAASSAVPLHFGLGTAATVTRAEIRWPSGKVQILTNLPANQVHRLSEPSPLLAHSALAPGDPALVPPPVNLKPGPEYADKTRIFQGIPGIERAPNGRLWALWYAGGPDEPGEGPGNYVVLVTSGDDGRSWSAPKLVIDPPGPVRAYDPCLWHDPRGRLWLFWSQSYGWWDGRSGVWAIVTSNSGEETPQWSAPRRLSDGIMMNKPTVLTNGEWLMPAAVWERPATAQIPPEFKHDLGARRGANVMVSTDKGETWQPRGQVLVPERVFDEHMIVERRGGSLWMLVRAAYGIGESVSLDHGTTWEPGRKSQIPHVNSRFFVRRLRSGRLLLVTHNPPDRKSRSHLIARLSEDDGKTWEGGLMIDERLGVSYPDGVESPGGTIYVIYDYSRTGDKQILMATFTENDVLTGDWRSPQVRQRVLVNQATGTRPAR